ncbi:hypothetical protein C900_02029 [Fulvivirga imtechensis AK7]|uniref:Uncharacterized protein n=1 Tax=Fulvivirga imtechensis AK7 TaxID=1237149 RepID=L8JWN7_9BACT|nr:hypothetical protein C900_02029 [Fulvivirga imtechensis AK7]
MGIKSVNLLIRMKKFKTTNLIKYKMKQKLKRCVSFYT